MNRYHSLLIWMLLVFIIRPLFAQKPSMKNESCTLKKSTGEPIVTLLNINNMSMWIHANGVIGYRSPNSEGVTFPYGTASVINSDGIIWAGFPNDLGDSKYYAWPGTPRIGGTWGLKPGRIIKKGVAESFDNHNVRIWRIRRDWRTADLRRDASEFFAIPVDSITENQIITIRDQYKKDWEEWPWEKGAPFYDNNENGIMDEGEDPGYKYGDQVVWLVANDLDYTNFYRYWDCPPMGIEMQITFWAYNRKYTANDGILFNMNESLNNTIFKRIRLIYKGTSSTPDTASIDSMYVSQYVDADIGNMDDDLVGCDTLLNMGFCYNASNDDRLFSKFNLPPPAVGHIILLGPKKNNIDQSMNIQVDNNNRLGLTAFTFSMGSFPLYDCARYYYSLAQYSMMRGFIPFADLDLYYPHPPGVVPGPFPYAGDPVRNVGHIDGQNLLWSFPPGDRRFMINTGPFTMALGDTQEVIFALVGGLGADYLSSISVMKYHAKAARFLAHNNFEIGFTENNDDELHPMMENVPLDFMLYPNFPNPFNAGTEIRYDLPLEKNVRLVIYNVLGQAVKVIVDETQVADKYSYRWDGTDDFGEKVPSGVYFCRLEAGYWVLTRKMTLLE